MSSTLLRSSPLSVAAARVVKYDRRVLSDLPVGEYVVEETRVEDQDGMGGDPFVRVVVYRMTPRESGGGTYRKVWWMGEASGMPLPACEKHARTLASRFLGR